METGRDEGAVATAVVSTDASHCHNLIVQIVGVLGINARRRLFIIASQIVVV